MNENIFKVLLTTVFAALSLYFRMMIVPLIILVFVMTADYATGMASAWLNKSLSSRIGIIGIIKKVCYLLVAGCGMVVDWLITSALVSAGITMTESVFVFGLLVIIWLIVNELLSILENLTKIGVPLPKFLSSMISKLKVTVETKADLTEYNNKNGGGNDGNA